MDKFSLLTLPPGSWGVLLKLNAPFLPTQAVQFALFNQDPVDNFYQIYHEKLPHFKKVLNHAQPQQGTPSDQTTHAILSTCWDQGFKKITGDNMYLLTSNPTAEEQTTTGSTVIFSNSGGGLHWLSTKSVTLADQNPICWCLPIYLEPGQKTQLTLSIENYLDLAQISVSQ